MLVIPNTFAPAFHTSWNALSSFFPLQLVNLDLSQLPQSLSGVPQTVNQIPFFPKQSGTAPQSFPLSHSTGKEFTSVWQISQKHVPCGHFKDASLLPLLYSFASLFKKHKNILINTWEFKRCLVKKTGVGVAHGFKGLSLSPSLDGCPGQEEGALRGHSARVQTPPPLHHYRRLPHCLHCPLLP